VGLSATPAPCTVDVSRDVNKLFFAPAVIYTNNTLEIGGAVQIIAFFQYIHSKT